MANSTLANSAQIKRMDRAGISTLTKVSTKEALKIMLRMEMVYTFHLTSKNEESLLPKVSLNSLMNHQTDLKNDRVY